LSRPDLLPCGQAQRAPPPPPRLTGMTKTQFLDLDEAAALLGMTRDELYLEVRQGLWPAVKVPNRGFLLPRSAIKGP
jgi:hypothetical protein